MTSYLWLKVVHLAAVFLLMAAVGAQCAVAASREDQPGVRKLAAALHGLTLAVIVVVGLMMLARLGMEGGVPGWIWLKLLLWLLFGALPLVVRRLQKTAAQAALLLLPLLAAVAAWAALLKPGV
jgi:uncharacterized membrane protein